LCSCRRRSPSRISRALTAPDPVDGLEVAVARPDDRVERREVLDEMADDVVGKPGDAREDPVAPRLDAEVERIGVRE
jgi:hypothetical protein